MGSVYAVKYFVWSAVAMMAKTVAVASADQGGRRLAYGRGFPTPKEEFVRSTKLRFASLAILGVMALAFMPGVAAAAPDDFVDAQAKPGAVAALAAVCQTPVNGTNTAVQRKVVTSNDARFYTSTAWTDLECGTLQVSVPAGMRAGAVVKVDAEVLCTEQTDTTEWCLGRVLFGSTEGQPNAPEGDSFAWAQSTLDIGAWESAAFTRSLTLSCPEGATGGVCFFTIKAQVRNHAEGLLLRVDDSTVDADLTYYKP
jgi:hypothetical protein